MDNSTPGKDISIEDIQSKFPLAAKKRNDEKTIFNINGVQFGSGFCPILP